MKTRMMRKIAVLVTGSALALSFPIASSVAQPNDGGGHSRACDNVGKSHGQGPKELPQQASNGHGWKCGFRN
jgi:hypothetical protein